MVDSNLLPIGSKAPFFTLKSTPDQTVSLTDFQGKKLIMIFYPADFSPVCSDELAVFNELLPVWQKHNAVVVGISVDSIWSHLAFAKERNIHFPLLSDFHPKGEISKAYNSYQEEVGESARSLYILDEEGNVMWHYLSPVGVNPGADGVLEALESSAK